MVTRCGMCGHEFEEDRSQPVCRACPVSDGCGLVRCPTCGYENPKAPGWLAALRRLVARWRGGGGGRGETVPAAGIRLPVVAVAEDEGRDDPASPGATSAAGVPSGPAPGSRGARTWSCPLARGSSHYYTDTLARESGEEAVA